MALLPCNYQGGLKPIGPSPTSQVEECGTKISTEMDHGMGVRRPLIHSQIQNIRLRSHSTRPPLARLHEESSEGRKYINPSFRHSLHSLKHSLFLSFTKKKRYRGQPWSVVLSSSSQKYQNPTTWSALLLFLRPSYPKADIWGYMGPFLCAASLSPKTWINSCHEICLAFSNNFINTTLLSAPDTTSKMENLCAMFAFEV